MMKIYSSVLFVMSVTSALSFAREVRRVRPVHEEQSVEIRPALPLTEADYDPPEIHAVTNEFGRLRIIPTRKDEGPVHAIADNIPWSAWWYPTNQKDLFESDGGLAPLQKYDLIVKAEKLKANDNGAVSSAALYEKEHLYKNRTEEWDGHCLAWSLASIYEKEPARAITVDGVELSIADQKALLIKSYENTSGTKLYGQVFTGHWDGSVYEDIKPDQFHKFLQHELFGEKKGDPKRAFIMDHSPGEQIWNVPVFEAQTEIVQDTQRKVIFHVKTVVTYALSDEDVVERGIDPRTGFSTFKIRPDYRGTDSKKVTYTYDLIGTPEPINDKGEYEISFGVWTGNSRIDHPDYVISTDAPVKKASLNPNLDPKKIEGWLAN